MAFKERIKDVWETVSGDRDVVGAVVQLLMALGNIVVRTITQQPQEKGCSHTD